jgi:hypothetical protein
VKTTRLGVDWNEILKPGAAIPDAQKPFVEAVRALQATKAVSLVASPISAVVDYALHKNETSLVTVKRPDTAPPKIVIPLNDKETVTAVRTRVDRKKDGCTTHGLIEGTDEPVILMWWKAERFSGVFTYRGNVYYLKDMGGKVHAVIEADPTKLPPDHAARKDTRAQSGDVKDDPLVATGAAAAERPTRLNQEDKKDAGASPTAERKLSSEPLS